MTKERQILMNKEGVRRQIKHKVKIYQIASDLTLKQIIKHKIKEINFDQQLKTKHAAIQHLTQKNLLVSFLKGK